MSDEQDRTQEEPQEELQANKPGHDWLFNNQVEHGMVTGLGPGAPSYPIENHLVQVPTDLSPHLLRIPLFQKHFYGAYRVPTAAGHPAAPVMRGGLW